MTLPFSGTYLGVAFSHDQFTVSTTAKGVDEDGVVLTSPVCVAVRIYTSKALRYTLDGTVPTATLGILVADAITFDIVGASNVNNLSMIRSVADATLDVVYFRA